MKITEKQLRQEIQNILLEASRKEDASAALEKYSHQPDVFFHYAFTNDAMKETSVSNFPRNSGTPIGVYAYDAKTFHGGRTTFGSGRPWVFVLKSRANLLSIEGLSSAELHEKLSQLAQILDPGVHDMILQRMEKYAHRLPSSVSSLPGATLYYVAAKSHKTKWTEDDDFRASYASTAPVDPRYTTWVLKKLGYGGLVDTTGVVWSSEPNQVCFFSTKYFEVIDIVRNPSYDGRDLKLVT